MKKRLVLFLGIGLILASLVLLAAFLLPTQRAVAESEKIAAKLEALLPEKAPAGVHTGEAMPALELGGRDYMALLEVSGLVLPVADPWDSGRVSRFSGSAYDNSLVIGGPDHSKLFGFCSQIDLGAPITLTDMTGGQFSYKVVRVDRSQSAQAPWLEKEEYDLTLFCRATLSMEYIAVRCQAG